MFDLIAKITEIIHVACLYNTCNSYLGFFFNTDFMKASKEFGENN